MIGVYKIINTINGKVYIGQAQDIERRWNYHKYSALKGESNVLYKAMRKYGIDNFSFEVIEECSIEELNEKEIYYIEQYNSYIHAENSNGYNMTLGGDGVKGLVRTEEFKIKFSESRKGEKHPLYGKTFTEEHRKKMSEAHKGKYKRGKSPSARRVVCEGKTFDCIEDCADFYEVKYSTMKAWLRGQNKMPLRFVELDLHYEEREKHDN